MGTQVTLQQIVKKLLPPEKEKDADTLFDLFEFLRYHAEQGNIDILRIRDYLPVEARKNFWGFKNSESFPKGFWSENRINIFDYLVDGKGVTCDLCYRFSYSATQELAFRKTQLFYIKMLWQIRALRMRKMPSPKMLWKKILTIFTFSSLNFFVRPPLPPRGVAGRTPPSESRPVSNPQSTNPCAAETSAPPISPVKPLQP